VSPIDGFSSADLRKDLLLGFDSKDLVSRLVLIKAEPDHLLPERIKAAA